VSRVESGAPAGARSGRPRGLEWLLVAAAAAYAGVLLAGPMLAMAWGALAGGLESFFRQLGAADALNALKLTLLLAGGATVINTLFGLCIAWVLARDDFRGRRLLNGLVDLPFVVSPVIAGFVIFLLFGRGGWFAPVIDALNLQIVFAWPGMLLATTFVSLPFVVREVVPVLVHVGVDQEQAAYTMGASPLRTFRTITLPNIRWGLLYGVSLTFARALGEFGAVLVVSGSVSRWTETSTLFIFRALDDRNEVGAYAMALALAAASFGLLLGMEYFKRNGPRMTRIGQISKDGHGF
jgi:sulfate/thiosulfate transport system permease protein